MLTIVRKDLAPAYRPSHHQPRWHLARAGSDELTISKIMLRSD